MPESAANRRSFFKRAVSLLGYLGIGVGTAAAADTAPEKKTVRSASGVITHQDVPLFSSAVVHNGLVYLAGKGAHFEGDIKAHTDHVLNEMEKELEEAGSSMEQVLKVNVYLHDLEDYDGLNEVFRGRFGANPPVRTTVSCYGGIPGDSLVEMDCIAVLDD